MTAVARVPGFGHRDRMIFSMTEAEWDAVGTFNCTRAASIRMREQLRTIVGQIHPLDVFVDTVHDELVVSDCGADCAESFTQGVVVTLTPTPASGSVFTGWGGATATVRTAASP